MKRFILTMPATCFIFMILFSSCFCNQVLAGQESSDSNKPLYSFGVFPFLPASRLEGTFASIAAEFSHALGRRMHYRSASTFEKFMTRLEQQEFDIAFIQPFDYVRIAKRAGYMPLAKRKEKLYAIFAVKEDTPFQSIYDLKGKVIAMAPEVAALSYLGKTALLQAGLDPKQDVAIKYMRGHHSCLQQVLIGDAGACVTGRPAMRVFEEKMNVKLRVVAETPDIPPMLFVVHSRLPERDREILRKTLLETSLSGVEPRLRTLFVKDKSNAFIPASDAEYDIVRRYWNEIKDK